MVRRRRNRKWLWIVWGVILVSLVLAVFVAVSKKNESREKKNEAQSSEAVNEEQTAIEGETVVDESSDIGQAEKQKVRQYEGEDPNVAEELSGVVTYAGVNDGTLMIRTSIDQYLASGSCELTLVRGGDTIYNSIADIVGDASTAVCQGFDVPTAGLGGGKVQIIINLSADGKVGTIRGEAEI